MNPASPDPEPTLPSLPPDVHDALLDALFGDPRRRAEGLARLLARSDVDAAAVQAHIANHDARSGLATLLPGLRIPGYRIVRQIGEGGMGTVFAAEQTAPLQRRVAIKLIKGRVSGREVIERFERERQSLAVMDHDAIAKVFDCGTTPDGQPFFAMEYVDGKPIDVFADEHCLPLQQRIELFLQVCRGVQHAHQKGVIHRDLKPSNVLVGERDGVPFAKVIDFGIARTVVRTPTDELQTEVGQMVGTPAYMSPEQAEAEHDRIDTRSDVYSLGVMLYELLCGASPFVPRASKMLTITDLREQIRAGDLPRPSTRLQRFGELAAVYATRRRTTVTSLRRALVGDLDWIVLRAIAREPERRYPSAIALADDLQRHLEHLPVTAGPPTAWYRLRKFARRYRTALVAASLVFLAIVGGLVGTGLALVRVQRSQARFDLLAHVLNLSNARAEAEALHPAWPDRCVAFAAWHADRAEPLLRAVPTAQTALAELALVRPEPGETTGDLFLREALTKWLADVKSFAATDVVDMRARSQWAAGLAALQEQPQCRERWQAARTAIREANGITASRLYAAVPIDLQPQPGLLPVGMNPRTGLWEFYELRSAVDLAQTTDPSSVPLPVFDAAGNIAVGEATGIMFVLIPGGTFTFGAQNEDPNGPNFDELMPDGGKTFAVTLSPFFLARHELTQGQWQRLGGTVQPFYPAGRAAVTLAHPIEQVSWTECNALLARHGLQLPTDVQLEYGCRAGTTTPWHFGPTLESLRLRVNLLDIAAQAQVPEWKGEAVPWDDGFIAHAPVGAFPANNFGLHDVHGNVHEWCADGHAATPAFAPGDGRQVADDDGKRVFRGGSFLSPAQGVRSAWRYASTKDWRSHDLGCRAARTLTP